MCKIGISSHPKDVSWTFLFWSLYPDLNHRKVREFILRTLTILVWYANNIFVKSLIISIFQIWRSDKYPWCSNWNVLVPLKFGGHYYLWLSNVIDMITYDAEELIKMSLVTCKGNGDIVDYRRTFDNWWYQNFILCVAIWHSTWIHHIPSCRNASSWEFN